MQPMEDFARYVSLELGHGGEITDEVIDEVQRLLDETLAAATLWPAMRAAAASPSRSSAAASTVASCVDATSPSIPSAHAHRVAKSQAAVG